MGSKTIGLREDVYRRLRAAKRENESFTDLLDRLLEETTADWRDGFGTLDAEEAADLERLVGASRGAMSRGLAQRQAGADEDLDDATR